MSSSEIAKLETRWRENPHGLTFAPLAEAYRKLREPARALEVLAEGLGRHPDYIPASIVLGRCHLDLGQRAEAESAFRRVLELDDENAIALRALADLAEQDGRLAEAAGRLQELLSVDRSNEDPRAQLARIEAALATGPLVAEETAGHDWTPEVPAGFEASGAMEPGAPDVPEADASAVGDDLMLEDNLQPAADIDPLPDLMVDEVPPISSESVAAPPLGDLVGKDFRRLGEEVTPLSDLATGAGALLPSDLGDEAEPAHAFESDQPVELEQELERSTEIELHPAERSEFQVESATDEWIVQAPVDATEASDEAAAPLWSERADEGTVLPANAGELPPHDRKPAEPFESHGESEPAPAPVHDPVVEPEPVAEPVAYADFSPDPEREDADLVVTETMAELYLRQGHRSEALRVYRELWLRSGNDLRLREKVDALETELAAEESGAEAPVTAYAAPAPTRTVAAFLGSILQARPGGTPLAWTGEQSGAAQPLAEQGRVESPDAAPTRPAADHLSLSAVFGETGSPVPPAVAAGAPAEEDGLSFDAFFGGETSAAPARARAASRDDDDLDQFHAWLQNLKR